MKLRPVGLTSVVCKALESIMKERVMGHLMENNLLSGYQHGFVSGRSCTTNLLSTCGRFERIANCVDDLSII